jgi:hypothetical protein
MNHLMTVSLRSMVAAATVLAAMAATGQCDGGSRRFVPIKSVVVGNGPATITPMAEWKAGLRVRGRKGSTG